MVSPKISIITIDYNKPLLERICEYVVNQTFKDYEWIVVDGGGTILKRWQNLELSPENAVDRLPICM